MSHQLTPKSILNKMCVEISILGAIPHPSMMNQKVNCVWLKEIRNKFSLEKL
jgi:hypothetical protein